MVYNLVEYLKTQFTTLFFRANGFINATDTFPDTCNFVNAPGGDSAFWHDRRDNAIQIISRSLDSVTAKQNNDTIYDDLIKRFGFDLPAVTVNSIVYPLIMVWAFNPLQIPGWIGVDDNGRYLYSFNLRCVTKE